MIEIFMSGATSSPVEADKFDHRYLDKKAMSTPILIQLTNTAMTQQDNLNICPSDVRGGPSAARNQNHFCACNLLLCIFATTTKKLERKVVMRKSWNVYM